MSKDRMPATDAILQEFDAQVSCLGRFETSTKQLLLDVLRAHNLSFHSIQSRVKARESLRAKCERPDKTYSALSELTDIVAFRIITYFDDDVDTVAALLKRNFAVDDSKSIDKRKRKPSEFGYSALHHICRYTANRESLPENSAYSGLQWEVQVCSLLQHAWNEIEHDIGYKGSATVPTELQRRLSRLSGVLELVGAEFREIRDKANNYKQAVSIRFETNDDDVSDMLLDTISLTSFIEQDTVSLEAARALSEAFSVSVGGELPPKTLSIIMAGLKVLELNSIQDLRNALRASIQELPKWMIRVFDLLKVRGMNPVLRSVHPGIVLVYLVAFLLSKNSQDELLDLYRRTGAFGERAALVAQAQCDVTNQH